MKVNFVYAICIRVGKRSSKEPMKAGLRTINKEIYDMRKNKQV
jgi:hypothetical protein